MTGAEVYLGYLQELTGLSEQAKAATQAQDWDELLACLSQRQTVMDRIDALPDQARSLTPVERERAAGLLEKATELSDMMAAAVDTALITTRSALHNSSEVRTNISAYRRTAQGSPQTSEARFVDKNR